MVNPYEKLLKKLKMLLMKNHSVRKKKVNTEKVETQQENK
jgi:hypothetical protein